MLTCYPYNILSIIQLPQRVEGVWLWNILLLLSVLTILSALSHPTFVLLVYCVCWQEFVHCVWQQNLSICVLSLAVEFVTLCVLPGSRIYQFVNCVLQQKLSVCVLCLAVEFVSSCFLSGHCIVQFGHIPGITLFYLRDLTVSNHLYLVTVHQENQKVYQDIASLMQR